MRAADRSRRHSFDLAQGLFQVICFQNMAKRTSMTSDLLTNPQHRSRHRNPRTGEIETCPGAVSTTQGRSLAKCERQREPNQ
jgi:hypothetical protein